MSAEAGLRILNLGNYENELGKTAIQLSTELQKLMLKVKGMFISEDGREVDYQALKSSDMFQANFVPKARQLQAVNMKGLSRDEKTAFCINVYNALTIHALVMCDDALPSSVLEMHHFWRVHAYNIGGLVFSLDDLEHGVLRGNRAHPADSKSLFSADDPRLDLIIMDFDPRIHFALVCGAKSCPAISVYSPHNLEVGLQASATGFCAQEVFIGTDEVTLSKIFHWYRTDFGANDLELLRWVNNYLTGEQQDKMGILLQHLEKGQKVQIKFSNYNWNLNRSR